MGLKAWLTRRVVNFLTRPLARYERNGEAPYELALRVGDIEATDACLRERGVATSAAAVDADGTSIGVDSTRASGVLLRFVQPGG